MAIFKFEDILQKHGVQPTDVKSVGVTPTTTPAEGPGAMQTAKDVGIGVLKGVGSTISGLQNLGRGAIAAVDPTRTYADVKQDMGIKALDNEEMLKAQNPAQMTGKALELAVEVFFPVGKVAQGLGLAEKGTRVVGASLDNIGSRIASIGDDVMENGVKVKDKLINLVTKLDDKTKSALNRTPQEVFQEYVEIGKKAMQADENITPLEHVGNKIIDGLKQIKDRASSVGEAKSQIMEQAKVGYQKVGNIAQKTALGLQKAFSGMKLDPSDAKIVKEFQDTLMQLGDNPSLREVDAVIDLLQDRLYKAGRSNAVEVTDRITGKLRSAIGELNGQIQTIGGEAYKKANQEYSEIIQLVTELNARLGKEGSNAGSLVKRLFSPSDARTKELFKELQRLTGQDYFRDSRLAKFVMEALDDTRAASLLEQMPKSPGGVIDKVIDYGVSKITDPIKAAENFIKNK